MATAVQIQHRLSELESAGGEVAERQETLRQLLEEVNREIVALRAQYHTRLLSANSGAGGSRVLTSNKRAASGGRRAEDVARLEEERDAKMAPFQEIKTSIEEALARLEPGQAAAR